MMQRAWLTDLRKVALLNLILWFLSALVPTEKAFVSIRSVMVEHPDWSVWLTLAFIAAILLTLVPLAFFWAIYHERTKIVLPEYLRLIPLGAIIALLVAGFNTFAAWSFGNRDNWSVVTQQEWRTGAQSLRIWLQSPATIREFSASTATAAAVSYVFFLIAIFRQRDDPGRLEASASRLLAVVTRITLIAAGLVLAFLLIRVLLTPYLYSQLREAAATVGRNPPPFFGLLRDTIRDLLLGACYFTAPFLVDRTIRRREDSGFYPTATDH